MTESKPRHTPQAIELGQKIAMGQGIPTSNQSAFQLAVNAWATLIDRELGLPDLLAENERLRAQLAELREALGIIETWGGDYITGQSVYEFAGAALARSEKGE